MFIHITYIPPNFFHQTRNSKRKKLGKKFRAVRVTMGGGGVNNNQKLRDVIYGRPLIQFLCHSASNFVAKFVQYVSSYFYAVARTPFSTKGIDQILRVQKFGEKVGLNCWWNQRFFVTNDVIFFPKSSIWNLLNQNLSNLFVLKFIF